MNINNINKLAIIFEKNCLITISQVPIMGIVDEQTIQNQKKDSVEISNTPSNNENLESAIEAIKTFCRIVGSIPTSVGNPFSYVAAESEFEKNNYIASILYLLTAFPNLGVLAAAIKNFPTIIKGVNALQKLIKAAPVGQKALLYAKYKTINTIINLYKMIGAGTGGFKEKIYYIIWGILKEIFKYKPKAIITLAKKSNVISEEKEIKNYDELLKNLSNKISQDLNNIVDDQISTLNELAQIKEI